MIEYTLTTRRQFKDQKELMEYCEQMKADGMFEPNYWNSLAIQGVAFFQTTEPANNTQVISKGVVSGGEYGELIGSPS